MARQSGSSRLARAAKVCFWLVSSVGGLLFLAYGAYLAYHQLLELPWSVDFRYLITSLPVYWAALGIAILNWNSIVRSLGVGLGLRRNMKLYCFANLTKQLPTIFWFVGTRVLLYEREGVSKVVTSTGVMLELLLLTLSNAAVCLLILPALPTLQAPPKILALILFLPLLLVAARPQLLIRLANALLSRLGKDPLEVGLRWQQMVTWCTLYSLTWVLGGVYLYLLVMAVSPAIAPTPLQIIAAWAFSGLASKLRFVLPVGLAWGEVSLAYLLSLFMPLPTAVLITVLSRIWLALNEGSWFLISLGL